MTKGKPHSTIPAAGTSRLVRQFCDHLGADEIAVAEVERRTGLPRGLVHRWFRGTTPVLGNFEAACNAAGLEIVLRRKPT